MELDTQNLMLCVYTVPLGGVIVILQQFCLTPLPPLEIFMCITIAECFGLTKTAFLTCPCFLEYKLFVVYHHVICASCNKFLRIKLKTLLQNVTVQVFHPEMLFKFSLHLHRRSHF
jgi:hypothetical protein